MNDVTKFTNEQLTEELKRRLITKNPPMSVSPLLVQRVPPSVNTLRPYEIMKMMEKLGWQENPRVGYGNPAIDRMWNYLGYPKLTDDQSWCACTMNTCLKLAGFETSDSIPVARSFESYGKPVHFTNEVREGDIVVFKQDNSSWKGHVGFVVKVHENKNTITVLAGNQNNKVSTRDFFTNREQNGLRISEYRRISDVNKTGEEDKYTQMVWGL